MSWFYHHWSRVVALAMFIVFFIQQATEVGTKLPAYLYTKGDLVDFFVITFTIFLVGWGAGAEWFHERLHRLADEHDAAEAAAKKQG